MRGNVVKAENAASSFQALWNAAKTAEQLGMSQSWVYKAAERGELPCVRVGAALRFSPEAIGAWLAKRSNSAAGTLRPVLT